MAETTDVREVNLCKLPDRMWTNYILPFLEEAFVNMCFSLVNQKCLSLCTTRDEARSSRRECHTFSCCGSFFSRYGVMRDFTSNPTLLEWFSNTYRRGCIFIPGMENHLTLFEIAYGGNVDILQLYPPTSRKVSDMCVIAIHRNHFAFVRHLYQQFPEQVTACIHISHAAAMVGNLDALKWMQEKGFSMDYITLYKALLNEHYEVMKWLVVNVESCEWHQHASCVIAERGRRDILEWAIEHGCTIRTDTCTGAASGGYVEMLRWLVQDVGCDWNARRVAITVCSSGHIEILELLSEWGVLELDEVFCTIAAQFGRVDVLEYLFVELECPFSARDVLLTAVRYEKVNVVEWALNENGLEFPPDSKVLKHAIEIGNGAILRLLRKHGYKLAPEDSVVTVSMKGRWIM